VTQVHFANAQRDRAAFQPRALEQSVDQRLQPVDVFAGLLHHVAGPASRVRFVCCGQCVQRTADQRQRRAQLVADAGDEARPAVGQLAQTRGLFGHCIALFLKVARARIHRAGQRPRPVPKRPIGDHPDGREKHGDDDQSGNARCRRFPPQRRHLDFRRGGCLDPRPARVTGLRFKPVISRRQAVIRRAAFVAGADPVVVAPDQPVAKAQRFGRRQVDGAG